MDTVEDESNANNNCSPSVAVMVVSGGGAPDLVVESPSVSESDVEPGASFTLSATVRNGGDGEAAATTLRYYRSTDATLSAGDAEVGTDAVGALAASSTSNQSISLTAPSTAGTYYYGACVDSISRESDAGNNCSSAVRVTVSDGQMEIESFDLDSANGDAGGIVFANDSLYVVDRGNDRVYAYRASGQRDSASDFYLDNPGSGITYANGKFYVVGGGKVYAYDASGQRDSASDFDLDSANGSARGIAFANDRFNVVDRGDAKVYAYDAAGQRDSDFDLDSANGYAGGIAFANNRFYVVDGVDDKVYAYDASGERAADFQLDSANGSASGITFANGGFYIVDRSDEKVYAYPDRPDRPDLVIESTSASDGSPMAGESFTLSATVRNRGGGPSDATTLRYYRSANTTIFTTDREMGTDAVGGIAAAAAGGGSISLTAPSIAGTYYYGACVDSVSGESDPTNNCSSAVPVTAAQASDGGVYVRHESLTIGPGWVRYFSFQAGSCIELDGTTVLHDGVPYILISSKWQTRANSSDAWADVPGTSESSGRLCVYDPVDSGAYRLVAEISTAFAEMERNVIRQRVPEGMKAARARGRKGGRPRIMTVDKLRYARHLMADRTRSIPDIRRELDDRPGSTLYHYLASSEGLYAGLR